MKTPKVRSTLWWFLAGALVLSGGALYWPAEPVGQVDTRAAATTGDSVETQRGTSGGSTGHQASPGSQAIPGNLVRLRYESASSDPFAPVAGAPQQAAVAAIPPVPVPVEPLSQQVPALGYTLLGRMTAPDGNRHLYALDDKGTPVALAAGLKLATGYVVEAIEPEQVVFLHLATDLRVVLVWPAAEAPRS